MQGLTAVEAMRAAVESLEETERRLRFERAKARVLERHRDLYAKLAEHERKERAR